jgi:hypothetical protein
MDVGKCTELALEARHAPLVQFEQLLERDVLAGLVVECQIHRARCTLAEQAHQLEALVRDRIDGNACGLHDELTRDSRDHTSRLSY